MRIIIALLLAAFGWSVAGADTFVVDKPRSIFAVVTHKGGIAAAMAHNHLVYAGEYEAEIAREGEGVNGGRFHIKLPVAELVPDTPEVQKAWFPRIQALGILKEPFAATSEDDRRKIRKAMLSDEQLDAEQHPQIEAEVVAVREEASRQGEVDFTHAVKLRFTVHGKTVEREIPANITLSDDTLQVEATGRFKFTEFGMKPYSAFLGAVETKDEFDLYVNLQAKRS